MSDDAAGSSSRDAAPLVWFVALAVILTAVALIVYGFATPHVRRNLSREHGVIETPTAALFLAAAAIAAYRLRRAGIPWREARWIVPVLSLIAMLDEVNWIVFPLGVRRPTVFGHRVDGLHDFVDMAVAWIRDQAPWWSLVVIGVAAAAILSWTARQAVAWWPVAKWSASWRFVVLALGLGLAAQAVDIFASQRNRLAKLVEEVLELNAALALVFAAARLTSSRAAPRESGRGPH